MFAGGKHPTGQSGSTLRVVLVALTAAVLFGYLARPLFQNQVILTSDLGRYHLPVRAYFARCLQTGDDYTWSPHLFCGFYLHGEGQGGFYHPWHQFLYSTMPLVTAFNLELISSYGFLFAGMLLFLRHRGLPPDAALLGAAAFTFSGFTLSHYPHMNAIAIVAHYPWLLLATDVLWHATDRRRIAFAQTGVALLTASQILLGYPQYLWFSALLEATYLTFLMSGEMKWGRLLLFVLAKALGLLSGCLQFVPSVESLQSSVRPTVPSSFRGVMSLNPWHLLQLVVPSGFNVTVQPGEYTVYTGALATVSLVWLCGRGRAPGSLRPLVKWCFVLVGIATALALGKYTPLFPWYQALPIIGVFRCPCRYLVLVHLATAVLSAIAFAGLVRQRHDEPSPWRNLAPLAFAPTAAWIGVAIVPFLVQSNQADVAPFMTNLDMAAWGAGYVTLFTLLFVAAARGFRGTLALLLMVASIDPAVYCFRSIDSYGRSDLAEYRRKQEMPPSATGRVEIEDVFGNGLMLSDVPLTTGYVGLTPPRFLDYTSDTTLRLCGTTWRHTADGWKSIPDPLPRARFVTKTVPIRNLRVDVERIDIRSTALTFEQLDVPPGQPGKVEIISDRPGRIGMTTAAGSDQLLVLAEGYHNGWTARVDGRPAPVVRINGDFQGCVVLAGQHEVDFRFAPRSLRIGGCLSVAGLVLTGACLVILLRGPGFSLVERADRASLTRLIHRIRLPWSRWAARRLVSRLRVI